MSNFVGQLNISAQMTQVAVVGVAEFVNPLFALNAYNNVNDLQTAIRNLPAGSGSLLEPNMTG